MREDYATNLLAAVRRGELDAALTALTDTRKPPPALRSTKLATDPMALATSPDHPITPSPAATRSRSANYATNRWTLWSGLWGLLQRMLMPIL